jgi:kinesin family member C1
VFAQQSSQAEVYDEVTHLVQSFLDGNDVCIFSYGQTGSGKTYTMGTEAFSDESDKGIVPRAVDQVLSKLQAYPESERPQAKVMFQEIYLDSIRDLLDKSNFMT